MQHFTSSFLKYQSDLLVKRFFFWLNAALAMAIYVHTEMRRDCLPGRSPVQAQKIPGLMFATMTEPTPSLTFLVMSCPMFVTGKNMPQNYESTAYFLSVIFKLVQLLIFHEKPVFSQYYVITLQYSVLIFKEQRK
jgi:hypothetical protein